MSEAFSLQAPISVMHIVRMETGVYSRCGNLRNLTNDDRSHETDEDICAKLFYKDSQGFPMFVLGGLLFFRKI